MQFKLYGKIIRRSVRRVPARDGSSYDLYQIVIEEPGQYPSRFQLGSRDASLFGQPDGPFAVGRLVTASGFVNGSERQATTRDGKPFTTFPVYFTIRSLVSADPAPSTPQQTKSLANPEIADDIPF